MKANKFITKLLTLIIISFSFISFNNFSVYADANQRSIRVGFFNMEGFHEFDENHNAQGYDFEYLKKIKEITDWDFEYIQIDTRDQALQLLEDKKIDLLAPSFITDERTTKFDFSAYPIGTDYGALFTLDTNDHLIYEDFESFYNIKIGCLENQFFKEPFIDLMRTDKQEPQMVYYKDYATLKRALNGGEVDAIVSNLMTQRKDMKLLAKFYPSNFYYMTYKDNEKLLNELNKAIYEIQLSNSSFSNELLLTYYPTYNYTPFTKSEIDYIKNTDVINIGFPSDQDPVSYVDSNNEVQGITKEIVNLIEKNSGLKFNYVPLRARDVDYAYLLANDIDIVASVDYNNINANTKNLILSHPYLLSSKVFVANSNFTFDETKPLKLGISTASQTLTEVIKTKYPSFKIVDYDTSKEALNALLKHKVDIVLQNQYTVENTLQKPIYDNLVVISQESLEDKHSLSVLIHYDNGEITNPKIADKRLISIINKSIDTLDRHLIYRIMISQTVERHYQLTFSDFMYRYRYFIIVIGIILLMFLNSVYHIMKLRSRNLKIAKESEIKLMNITNNINGGVVVLETNEGFTITYANDGFLDLIQMNRQQYDINTKYEYRAFIHPDDICLLNEFDYINAKEEDIVSLKLRIRRYDGTYITTLFNGTFGITPKGKLALYCVIVDISEQINTLNRLALQQERYETLMKKSDEILIDYDLETKELKVSDKFEEKFGWALPKSLFDNNFFDDLHLEIHDSLSLQTALKKLIMEEVEDLSCRIKIMTIDNISVWCDFNAHVIINNGRKTFIIGKIVDVSNLVANQEALKRKAQIDDLSGLFNKAAFYEETNRYLTNTESKNNAVVFIDIDNFKSVNDVLGHMVGDQAIKDFATKLRLIFSNNDIISRFGGDEFCIFVKDIPLVTIENKLEWAVEKLQDLYFNEEHQVKITASIGLAYAQINNKSITELLINADKALYSAKEKGKNRYVLYDSTLKLKGYISRNS